MVSLPARKLKASSSKSICRFASTKSSPQKNVLTEVILEMNYCYHLEFNDEVVYYKPQPLTIEFVDKNGQIRKYTPDFEVRKIKRIGELVEVKPRKYIATSRVNENYQEIKDKINEIGFKFVLVDELEIEASPLLDNFKKLYRYRRREYLDRVALNRARLLIVRPISLYFFLQKLNGIADLKQIYVWLALGLLSFKIDEEELNLSTEVSFHDY